MAESADALVSGTSGGDIVEVQVPFGSPFVNDMAKPYYDIYRLGSSVGRAGD